MLRPLHHDDALRLAEEHRLQTAERWPRALELRRHAAYCLLRLAIRLDPPPRRTGRVLGAAVRR
jgi:hypothetical protein